MTEQESTIIIEMLSAIPFFPTAGGAQGMIAQQLAELCPTAQDGVWLATRAAQLYQGWKDCGMRGLYQIWFSKNRPKNARERELLDYLSGSTPAYPDGVPSERDLPSIEAPKMKALPVGTVASADPELEKLVLNLGDTLSNSATEYTNRDAAELGRAAKVAHPELAALDDAHIGRKILAHEKREEKRVDEKLRVLLHLPPAEVKHG